MSLPAVGFGKKSEVPDTISARRAFIEMPVLDLQLLPRDTREDMLIYFDNDSIWRARNAFQGYSSLDTVTPDYLKVNVTPVSTLQIKVFPGRKGDTVMTVYTVKSEGGVTGDSEVRFYDASMRELPANKYFKLPSLKDFFIVPKGGTVSKKDLEAEMPFYTLEITAGPGSEDVTVTFHPDDYLSMEGKSRITPYLHPDIKYNWDGGKLKIKQH